MLVRAPTAAALALSAAPTARMARAAVRSENADNADISGKCCGVAVSGTVWPPATARAITSSRDTTDEARLTAVVVPGATVQVTAVGDGASVRADLNRCGADGNMVHDGRMPPVHPPARELHNPTRCVALYSGGRSQCAWTPVSHVERLRNGSRLSGTCAPCDRSIARQSGPPGAPCGVC